MPPGILSATERPRLRGGRGVIGGRQALVGRRIRDRGGPAPSRGPSYHRLAKLQASGASE